EAGSDHLAGAVDASRGAGVVEHADRGDAAIGDCDRGCEAVTAGAVEHGAVLEDEVEGHVPTIACANAVAQRAQPPALLSSARLRARGAGTRDRGPAAQEHRRGRRCYPSLRRIRRSPVAASAMAMAAS